MRAVTSPDLISLRARVRQPLVADAGQRHAWRVFLCSATESPCDDSRRSQRQRACNNPDGEHINCDRRICNNDSTQLVGSGAEKTMFAPIRVGSRCASLTRLPCWVLGAWCSV